MNPTKSPSREKVSRKSPLKYPLRAKSERTTSRIRSTIFTGGLHPTTKKIAPQARLRALPSAQYFFGQLVDSLAVRPAGNFGHDLLQHPPQVLDTLRAHLFNGDSDQIPDLFLAQGLGQEAAQDRQLRLFLLQQIGPSSLAKEPDRLLSLLAQRRYGLENLI